MTALLSRDHLEALQESFNIGIGRAGADLADLLGQEIRLGIPEIDCMTVEQAEKFMLENLSDAVLFVRQDFHGGFDGSAMLAFPEMIASTLAQLLLNEPGLLEQMDDVQEDAVVEVSNVILNGVVAAFAELLGVELATTLPRLNRMPTTGDEIQRFALVDDLLVVVNAQLGIAGQDLDGLLVLVLDPTNFSELKRLSAAAFGVAEDE